MALKQNFPLRFYTEELKSAIEEAAKDNNVSMNTFINNILKRSINKRKAV